MSPSHLDSRHNTSNLRFLFQTVSSDTRPSPLSIGSRFHQPTNIFCFYASIFACLLQVLILVEFQRFLSVVYSFVVPAIAHLLKLALRVESPWDVALGSFLFFKRELVFWKSDSLPLTYNKWPHRQKQHTTCSTRICRTTHQEPWVLCWSKPSQSSRHLSKLSICNHSRLH